MQIGLLKVKASVKAEEAFCSFLRADVVGDEFRCGSTWLLCVSSLQQGVLDGGALALSSCVRSWNDKTKGKRQKNAKKDKKCHRVLSVGASYPLVRNKNEFLLWHRQNPIAAQINDATKIVVIACFSSPHKNISLNAPFFPDLPLIRISLTQIRDNGCAICVVALNCF